MKLTISFISIALLLFNVEFAFAEIQLKEKAFVEQEWITIEDVISNKLNMASLPNLGSVVLGKSPEINEEKLLTKEHIIAVLKRNGFDTRLTPISGSDNVIVIRTKNREKELYSLLRELLSPAIKRHFKDKASASLEQIEVINTSATIEELESLIANKKSDDFEISDLEKKNNAGYTGQVKFHEDKKAKGFSLEFRLYWRIMAFVPQYKLTAGRVIGKDCFDKKMCTVHETDDVILDEFLIDGSKLKASLAKGEPIRKSHIKPKPVVKSRDLLKINIPGNGFIVQLDGYAMEEGSVGDIIRVRNKETNKIFPARVINSNTAEFTYGTYSFSNSK